MRTITIDTNSHVAVVAKNPIDIGEPFFDNTSIEGVAIGILVSLSLAISSAVDMINGKKFVRRLSATCASIAIMGKYFLTNAKSIPSLHFTIAFSIGSVVSASVSAQSVFVLFSVLLSLRFFFFLVGFMPSAFSRQMTFTVFFLPVTNVLGTICFLTHRLIIPRLGNRCKKEGPLSWVTCRRHRRNLPLPRDA